MIGEKESDYSLNRRTVLRCVLSGVIPTIAGCGDSSGAGRRSEKTPLDSMNSSGERGPVALEKIAEDVQEVFDRLRQFPITRDSEFVFEARIFKNEFDYQELKDKVDSVKARLEDLEVEDESGSQKAELALVTGVAENLIQQRILVHQIIAAGITFEELFGEGEYGRASEVIQDGRFFLNSLNDNREETIELVTQDVTSDSLTEDYDTGSVRETQVVLGEILRWTPPAYRGLHETVKGLQKFEEGNSAINSEEFGSALSRYQDAEDRFQSAEDAFDRAQGRGRRVPQIGPFVDGVRCMLPAYQTSSKELQRSMSEFEAGNDPRAREIGRETLLSAKRVAKRCL